MLRSMLLVRTFFLFALLISIFIANGIQLLGLLCRPFSRALSRRICAYCGAAWWGFLTYSLENFFGLTVKVHRLSTISVARQPKSVFLIANHQSLLDPVVLIALTYREKSLSYLKWFVKDSLKWVPFLGWGMQLLDCIFLKRNWEADQKKIDHGFKNILSHQDPIWLASFVEGTRKTPAKILQSQKYARSQNHPGFENVLFPRVKGFITTFKTLNPRIDAVYDLTIVYPTRTLGLLDLLRGRMEPIHLYVHEFAVRDLPQSEAELTNWLILRFQEKDRLLRK